MSKFAGYSIEDTVIEGIEGKIFIDILTAQVIAAYPGDVCTFANNNKHLWVGKAYTTEVALRYNHFRGKLKRYCKLSETCSIHDAQNVSGEMTKADNDSAKDLRELFSNLGLKGGGKMKVGGQSGGSPFSDALAIAMKISKMGASTQALSGITGEQLNKWLLLLTEKVNRNKESCLAFLYNNVLAQVFPSIAVSLELAEAAVADPETIVAFLRTYIPIFINRIQEASITVGDAVDTGAKHMDTSLANLALSDLSYHLENVDSEQRAEQRDRLDSLARMTQQLTDAKVSADQVKAELAEQKKMLIDVKQIVADTNHFLSEASMVSAELIQINNELAKLTKKRPRDEKEGEKEEEGEKQAKEEEGEKQAKEEEGEKQAKEEEEKKQAEGAKKARKGGKRKTKKQKKKASKTKKPKRSQKKQTKKRKQRKTQQKKAKK